MPCRLVRTCATHQCVRIILLACLAAVQFAGWAAAQDLRYLRHGSWSTENGLPENSVHQILQTKDGFLWIATEGGIVRFDGVSFKTFKHEVEPAFVSNDVCCLVEDLSGNLWAGTNDGLVRLRQGSFRRLDEKDGLPSAVILGVKMAGGKLLVQTASGIATESGDRFVRSGTETFNGPDVSGLSAKPQSGAVWTLSSNAVKLTTPISTQTWKTPGDLPGKRVTSLFVDRQRNAWVGTNNGLAVIKAGAEQAETIPALRGTAVLQTYEDREGNYWIGTESSGLHLLHEEVFRDAPGLSDQALTAVVQSGDGSVWIGTRNDGLRRIRDGYVENPVHAGILTSPFILSLTPGKNGDVWAGTPDGLNHIDAAGKVLRVAATDDLPDDYIRALATGPDGTVWLGTRRGLVRLKGASITVFARAEGLGSDLIGALLAASNGELWVGTSGGLSRLAVDGRIDTYVVKDGLPSQLVTALAEDRAGAVWVATGDGKVSRVRNNHIASVQNSRLQVGKIAAMLVDRAGFLWIRGENSVQRVAVADLNGCLDHGEPCAGHMYRYRTTGGMPRSEFVAGGSPLLWQMRDGQIWFATQRGATIAEGEPPAAPLPFPVVIERMLVDGTEQNLQLGAVSLAPRVTRIDIEYAGLSYAAPLETVYRYRLDGFDRDWTIAGTRRMATYTNLPPRRYTFRVEVMGRDGTWLDTQAQLPFRISPSVYQRWWFIVLAILVAVVTAGALYQLRLRSLRQRFDAVLRERNRMAREIHDTLAQDFVGVALQLDLVSQFLTAGKSDLATQQVHLTRKLVTDGLAEARRSIWELRAALHKDSLPTRLAALVKRYSGPSLNVHLQIGGSYRPLPARVEQEFLRIAQEALSNVQRHSGAANASVQLHFGADMLMMSVTDRGCGFIVGERAAMHGHYGIRGMQERAAALGATLLVVSGPGEGTTLTLRAKITGEEKSVS